MSSIHRILVSAGLALGVVACAGASSDQASDLHAPAMTVDVG